MSYQNLARNSLIMPPIKLLWWASYMILVLLYCLAGTPDRCVERRPLPADDELALPMRCAQTALERSADLEERFEVNQLYPGYVLSRWRCEREQDRKIPT